MSIDRQKYERFFDRLGLAEHPLGAFYGNEKPAGAITPKEKGHACIFALLSRARLQKETVCLDEEHTGCEGGAYYLGFRPSARPNIEYFLSCGIPGEMEGERYIKTPELAKEYFSATRPRKAPGKYCVFKPLDKFSGAEDPEIVVFFAPPDVLSGLFTLTNYAAERADAVRAPFSSGCGAILSHALKEADKEKPQAILGLFDVSARPFVEPEVLTFALPAKLFRLLLDNQEESFLITKSWEIVRKRIAKKA